MISLRILLSRLRTLRSARRFDDDLNEEVRAHLELLAADYVRRGMTPQEARLAARRAFGGVEQMKERHRDLLRLRWIDDLAQDTRYAARGLRRNPMFTAAAVVTLALGIGANAVIFTQLNAVLVRSLPVRDPDRLVAFSTSEPGRDPGVTFSYRTWEAFRQNRGALADVAASSRLRLTVEVDGGAPATAAGLLVSGNYHQVLGVSAMLGRTLQPTDDGPAGGTPVAVLGHGYWQRYFGGDRAAVGQSVRLNGQPFTIVGVTPPEFFGTRVGQFVEITVPLSMQPQVNAEMGGSLIDGSGADDFWLELTGRLWPGVDAADAETAGDTLFRQQIVPEIRRGLGPKAAQFGNPRLELQPGGQGLSELRQQFSRPLLVLMGFVGLVLLIACANVAGLLMARHVARRREIAVRASLGAGRWRLGRQFMTESLLLALAGGGVALVVAAWSSSPLAALLVEADGGELRAPLDTTVLLFTLGVAVLTGLAFGVVPALGLSHSSAFTALKSGGSTLRGGSRFGGRGWLVAMQTALAVVLLVGAALFVRTLSNLRELDLGFDQRVLALRLEPHGSNQKQGNEARLRVLYRGLIDRVSAIPGVTAASMSGATPLRDENPITPRITVPGAPQTAGGDDRIRLVQVFPGLFSTLGITLLAGRDLAAADDDARAPFVAVVNEAMARRLFGSPHAAIGRRFNVPGSVVASRLPSFEIVGVAANVRDRAVREDTMPAAYATFAQTPTGRGQMTLLVRTSQDPQALIPILRGLAREMDPLMPLTSVELLSDRVAATTRQEFLLALLSSLFGGLALVLAAVGLYGVIAFAVARRQGELGLRLALGATPAALKRQVLRDGFMLAVVGVAIGASVAVPLVRALSHVWFGVGAFDVAAFAGAATTLIVTALAASYLPARRAARVDPVVALRSE